MSENNEVQPETTQEPKSTLETDFKDQLKKEVKAEIKREYFHLLRTRGIQDKRKKLSYFLKFLVVFLLGLAIGLLAGHHHHVHGGYHLEGKHGIYPANHPGPQGE